MILIHLGNITALETFTNYLNKILDYFTPLPNVVNGQEYFEDPLKAM